jgi:hypothetical protein
MNKDICEDCGSYSEISRVGWFNVCSECANKPTTSEPHPGAWADAERLAYNYGLDD